MLPVDRRQSGWKKGKYFCAAPRNSSVTVACLSSMKAIQPPALKTGDKVGLLAPASSFNREAFDRGCDRLRQMGYEPVYFPELFARDLYFAGSAKRRLEELNTLMHRDDIAGLVCVR